MLPCHFNPYYRFTTPWIQVRFTPSYTFHFDYFQTLPSQCLSIYVKEHPIHALYVGFIHRLSACFFSDCFPWIGFSQSENKEYAGLLYIPPSIFLIKYCTVWRHMSLPMINRTFVWKIIYCTKGVLNRMHGCLRVIYPYSLSRPKTWH